jgi:flavin-dependent dehydrogenase
VNPAGSNSRAHDVVILGGALAGAAAALLLQQRLPALRVLVLERAATHTRKVGEATVEVSAYFLTRILGLTDHLVHRHLPKQGLRFWFANAQTASLADASEIGARYLVRLPSFQLDRAVLDEEVLRRAVAAGAELRRPATVRKVELQPGGEQTVTYDIGGQTETARARWVLDASGVAALLARQSGWWQVNDAHPTAAAWARWRGVADWDGPELARKFPEWFKQCHGLRGTATNHLMGDGWWAWVIPLQGGEVSVGAVFDQRLVEWPKDGPLGQRLKDFLCRHPVGRELLADATWIEDDVHWRRPLAGSSRVMAGDGFALVGDAAGFLDPFYSPGMDWLGYTVVRAVELVAAQQAGEPAAPLAAAYDADFQLSYQRWFTALYRDKYEYLGDYELMRLAFLLDVGAYYLGIVRQPYRRGWAAFREPAFSTAYSGPAYRFIRFYNRRFAALARSRRARGLLGRRNTGRRFLFGGFTLSRWSARHLLGALANWAWLELTEGWRSWGAETFARRPATVPLPLAEHI